MADENTNEKFNYEGLQLKGSFVDSTNTTNENPLAMDDIAEFSTISLFPNYSVADYIRDIDKWRKQKNPFAIKGFFFFKLFFNFDTSYGLLGNVITNNTDNSFTNGNCADRYLELCGSSGLYESEKIDSRRKSLRKFIRSLYHISEDTPWFFKEIAGLNSVKASYTTDDDFKDNSITITCSEESVDLRLGTLFDLYKYATYDNIRNKEIIPANLRKFELNVMFFNVPLNWHHTPINNDDTSKIENTEKKIDFTNYNNIMSFKMFTFQNCEFDVNSLTEFTDSISNESSFELGKNQIKIKYDRVYEHRLNEFEGFFVNQDGLVDFSTTENFGQRLKNIGEQLDKSTFSPDKIVNLKESHLGKIKKYYNNYNLYSNYTSPRSKYFLDKLKYMKEGSITGGNIYNYDFGPTTNYFKNKLAALQIGSTGLLSGNIYGYTFGPGTEYFKEKLNRIRKGTVGGNLYDYDYFFTFIKEGNNVVRVMTKYYEQKLAALQTGNPTGLISGSIYDYNFGPGSKYFGEKLKTLQTGNPTGLISGNIYDYNFGPGSKYFNKKLETLQPGLTRLIDGSIYDYKFGPGTEYFNKKLETLQPGSTGVISGNIYDYDLGPGTNYWEDKMNLLTDGIVPDISSENFVFDKVSIDRGKRNEFDENGNPYVIPSQLGELFEFNETGDPYIIPSKLATENAFDETGKPYIIPSHLAETFSFSVKDKEYESDMLLAHPNTFNENYKWAEIEKGLAEVNEVKHTSISNSFSGATPNQFKLSMNAQAIKNAKNMYVMAGYDGKAKTFTGKIFEGAFNRAKSELGF